MDAGTLERALRRAGLPVVRVSLGKLSDPATWRCELETTATDADRSALAMFIARCDPAVVDAEDKADQDARLADDLVGRAVGRVVWEELKKVQVRANQTLLTWDEFKDAVKTQIASR